MAFNYKQQLNQLVASGGSHKDQADKFRSILETILQLDNEGLVEGLKAVIESVVHENVSLVISRQILSEISCYLPKLNDELGKLICRFVDTFSFMYKL